VIVHATDINNFPDWTTVLKPGDHPGITKQSAIVGKSARFDTQAALMGDVEYGRATKDVSCSNELLDRIRAGVLKCEEADEDVYDYCLDHFPIGPTNEL
jgi:hypothetical protein